MKSRLEWMCNIIDQVLKGHGFGARVAGGYVAGNGVLFSLTETTFLDTRVRFDLKEALHVSRVMATVGVVLVNDRKLRRQPPGEQAKAGLALPAGAPAGATDVETVDLLDLIAAHEADVVQGTAAAAKPKEAVLPTRPLATRHVGPRAEGLSRTSRPAKR